MKVLRWILMFPGGLVASGIVGVLIGLPTRLVGIDAFYFTALLSHFVAVVAAAYIAPKHRLGVIITAVIMAIFVLLGTRATARGNASAWKRSKNHIASAALALTGIVGGVAFTHKFIKEEPEQKEVLSGSA